MEEIIGLWQKLVIRDRTDGAELDEYMAVEGEEMEPSEPDEMELSEPEMESIALSLRIQKSRLSCALRFIVFE